ncbi:hypothetical protein STEG23_012343, partial [Scotinomys teguina]
NKTIPKDWRQLVTAPLEYGPQLEWNSQLTEAEALKQEENVHLGSPLTRVLMVVTAILLSFAVNCGSPAKSGYELLIQCVFDTYFLPL